MTETKTAERAQPEAITAVPVRHPGRWVAIVVLAIVAAMFVHMLLTNDAFQWRSCSTTCSARRSSRACGRR